MAYYLSIIFIHRMKIVHERIGGEIQSLSAKSSFIKPNHCHIKKFILMR